MDDATTLLEAEYSLAEAAILSQRWVPTSTLPDVLARPAVITAPADLAASTFRKVVIRKSGFELSLMIPASCQMPRSLVQGAEEIIGLLRLPPGWNSYAAKPVGLQNAIAAVRLLAQVLEAESPAPIVVPTVRGGIQLEWHTKGINIEVYVDSPEKISFFAEEIGSGQSCENLLAGHEPELKSWLQRISGK